MKRTLVGIDLMESAVNQPHSDINHVIAREIAALHRIVNALLSRFDKFARNRAAGDLVFENKAFAGCRFDFQLDMCVLTTTSSLLLENLFPRRGLGNRLAISNLRLADICFNAELSLHSIDDNLKMQFTHAGNNRLASFMVGRNIE